MTAYEKPILTMSEVTRVLREVLGEQPNGLAPIEGGNLSRVFGFDSQGFSGVIKFSDLPGAYETEQYVSNLLTAQGVPFPRCLAAGTEGQLRYMISERVPGRPLADYSGDVHARLLPELTLLLARMSKVDVSGSHGYGWIRADGAGTYPTWRAYVTDFFGEEQTGNFWEGWHALFRTSCLEREVFEACYERLLAYSSFNEGHRHFVHGDLHPWNLLSDGSRLTGVIDGNFAYGDSLVDLASLIGTVGRLDLAQAYREHHKRAGIEIPHFEERLIGARLFKGLDALRFYAKMGWNDAYRKLRDVLMTLVK